MPASFDKLPKSALTILIDDREKLPLSFPGFKTQSARLITGDYTVKGLENDVSVERKSLIDLARCLHKRRTLLEDQFRRLLALPKGLLIIEVTPLDIDKGNWPHNDIVTPEFVNETIQKWRARGLAIALTGAHERASRDVALYLYEVACNYYQSHHQFFNAVNEVMGCHCWLAQQCEVQEDSAPRVAWHSVPRRPCK